MSYLALNKPWTDEAAAVFDLNLADAARAPSQWDFETRPVQHVTCEHAQSMRPEGRPWLCHVGSAVEQTGCRNPLVRLGWHGLRDLSISNELGSTYARDVAQKGGDRVGFSNARAKAVGRIERYRAPVSGDYLFPGCSQL